MGEQGALGIGEMGNDEVGNGDVGNGDMRNDEVGNGYVGNGHVDPNQTGKGFKNRPVESQFGARGNYAHGAPIPLSPCRLPRPRIKHPLSSVVFRKILKFIQQG